MGAKRLTMPRFVIDFGIRGCGGYTLVERFESGFWGKNGCGVAGYERFALYCESVYWFRYRNE